MNRENLLRMADYIEAIPQHRFDIGSYRHRISPEGHKYYDDMVDDASHECKAVGCVVGHCVILDKWENVPKFTNGAINYITWTLKFTGINRTASEWVWCFSGMWQKVDNTPTGAAKRIRHLLEHGLPDNWIRQMQGFDPLSY